MGTKQEFTKEDAQLPFTVMALLDTCVVAIDDIGEQADETRTMRYAPSVAVALRHAYDLLIEFHAKLELLDRLEVTA